MIFATSNIDESLTKHSHPIECPGRKVAMKDSRNLARAFSAMKQNITTEEIFSSIQEQYCDECRKELKKEFWNQVESASE